MGCDESQTNDENKAKPFHKMSEEEKKKAKKLMEEQDKNLKEEERNEDAKYYENFDWDGLMKKLPTQKTDEERKKRLDLWKQLNEYGNGFLSYKRLSVQIDKYLQLPNVVKNKGPVKLAFKSSCNKYAKKGVKVDDNLIEWMEFRIFLVYLRQYFEYWVMFQKMDKSGDHQISLEEFKSALPTMEKWGVNIRDPEEEFQEIDKNNSGTISFEEFCNYAIQESLDLEEDDGFDDEELKRLK